MIDSTIYIMKIVCLILVALAVVLTLVFNTIDWYEKKGKNVFRNMFSNGMATGRILFALELLVIAALFGIILFN